MPDETTEIMRQADSTAGMLLTLCWRFQQLTIDRLAIGVRTEKNPDFNQDTCWRLTRDKWHGLANEILQTSHEILTSEADLTTAELREVSILVADPYNRPDIEPALLDELRKLNFDLDEQIGGDAISSSIRQRAILPLIEFYAGLVRIDQRVMRMYDATRYEKYVKISLVIGAVCLLVGAIATGFKLHKPDFTKIPLEGSYGVLCGFALGIILDIRRRQRTRAMVEAWGEAFGCDLRGFRWRQLP